MYTARSKKLKRILAFLLAFVLIVTSDNSWFSIGNIVYGEEKNGIFVNGKSAQIADRDFSKAQISEYGMNLGLALGDTDADASKVNFKYLLSTQSDEDGWPSYNSETVLKPGDYFLACDIEGEVKNYGFNYAYGIKIKKVNIANPGNLTWNTESGINATWDAVTKDVNGRAIDEGVSVTYLVSLIKDDKVVSEAKNVEATSIDFASLIEENGYGVYTFSVKAVVSSSGSDRYNDSDIINCTTQYVYRDTILPEIVSYEAGVDDNKGRLVAKVKDNVSVTAYVFNTSNSAPTADSEEWISVNEQEAVEGINTLISDKITASGVYYIHIKDAENNITTVSEGICATKIIAYETLDDNDSLDESKQTEYAILIGNDVELDLQNVSLKGYNFSGWNADNSLSGTVITKIRAISNQESVLGGDGIFKVLAGTDAKIYANLQKQQYNVNVSADNTSITYDGQGKGIELTATLENVDYDSITYEWQKVEIDNNSQKTYAAVSNGVTDAASAFKNRFRICNVNESGTYIVKATIKVGEKSYTATSDEITATINPKDLKLFINNASDITYGDEVPALDSFTLDKSKTDGIVSGEDFDSLVGSGLINLGSFSTTYTLGANVGEYDILLSDAKANNYNLIITNGKLKVVQKNVTTAENISIKFYVNGEELDDYTVGYTSEAIKPDFKAYDNGADISSFIEKVEYSNNVNASTADNKASASITFTGNYAGSLIKEFTISKIDFNSSIIIKDKDNNVVSENDAEWTYGMTGMNFLLSSNPGSGNVTFYYQPAGNGDSLNTSTASKERIDDAGKYNVWAVIEETDNYIEKIIGPVQYTVNKRPIELNAKSNSWTFDGKTYSYPYYEIIGNLVGTDGFKYIKVEGSITEVGTADNIVSYELTPTTKSSNYDIKTTKGKLTVTSKMLTNPSGFVWDKERPGVIEWTPVSQQNLVVEYKLKLNRIDEDNKVTCISEVVTDNSEYDFNSAIKNDTKTNGIAGYQVEIISSPKKVEGTLWNDYSASSTSIKSEMHYTAELTFDYESKSIEKLLSYSNSEELSTVYLLQGEEFDLGVKVKKGYSYVNVAADKKDAISLKYGKYSPDMIVRTIQLKDDITNAQVININVSADDDSPTIVKYEAKNKEDASAIVVKIEAFDELGMDGYSLIKGASYDDVASKARKGELTKTEFTSDDGKGHYFAEVEVKDEGTHYLVLWDNGGNYQISPAKSAVTVYKITFESGIADEEATTTMTDLYKLVNTSITLPDVKYKNTGYVFKNWKGDSGVLYNNKATYSANANDNLVAQWSNEQYEYKVNYYYMDTHGNYGEPEVKEYRGNYGAKINSTTSIIQTNKVGFELDNSDEKVNSIELGISQNNVVNVYYKRNKYTISYSYVDPETKTTKTLTNEEVEELGGKTEYYYDEPYTIIAAPSILGYTFSGWNFGHFDTSQETMPNQNLTASGEFVADVTNYAVVCHLQNAPTVSYDESKTELENVGMWNAENNYGEKYSDNYSYDSDKDITWYVGTHGASVNYSLGGAPKIIGYTPKKVVVSYGDTYGVEAPKSDVTTVTGKISADDNKKLYINYYYDRNIYDLNLNVYMDSRNDPTKIIYQHKWKCSYGRTFTPKILRAFETYGYSDTDSENEWIKEKFLDGGVRKPEYKSYELADYTDWSSGSAPSDMPEGNVSITKEYVENNSAQYQIELYFAGVNNNNEVYYPDSPTYTVYYYESIGKKVTIGGDDTYTHNYETIGKMLDANYDSYELDGTNANNILETVVQNEDEDKDNNVIKVYFKRKKVPSTITYYYYDENGSDAQVIAQYTVKKEWGTTYSFVPNEFYYANSKAPVVAGDITKIQSTNTELLSKDFNDDMCSISYGTRNYISSRGYSYSPSKQIENADDIAASVNVTMGQKDNYTNVYYSRVDREKTFYMDVNMKKSSEKYTELYETAGENFVVTKEDGNKAVEDRTQLYVRAANKCDIYSGEEFRDGVKHDNYKVLDKLSGSYNYDKASIDTNKFTKVTVTKDGKSEEYYLSNENGTYYLYIMNDDDTFYYGRYLSYNIEIKNNGLIIGRPMAESLKDIGHILTNNTGYGVVRPSGGSYESRRVKYNYYQELQEKQRVKFVMGNKTVDVDVDYGTVIKPSEYPRLSTCFTVDEGYRIVWYEKNENGKYTDPVGDKSYTITELKTFYGKREKALIENCDYISYELSETVYNQVKDEVGACLSDGYYYVTEQNYKKFEWAKEGSDSKYIVKSSTIEKTYVNSEADKIDGKYPSVPYNAIRKEYYIDNQLVMITEQNLSQSYSGVSLEYKADRFLGEGFAYSEVNTDNKTQGYCQKEPISLHAYFNRLIFEEKVQEPYDSKTNAYITNNFIYGKKRSVTPKTKKGYKFDGWTFKKTKTDTNEKLTEDELKEISYSYDSETGNATYTMPPYNLYIEPIWNNAAFDYEVLHYFQKQDQSYANTEMSGILEAEAKGYVGDFVSFKFNKVNNETGTIVYSSDEKKDSDILAFIYKKGGVTYYLDKSVIHEQEDGSIEISASDSDIFAAKKAASFVSANDYTAGAHKMDTSNMDLFSYAFTSYQTDEATTVLGESGEFKAYADMQLSYFYKRASKYKIGITAISTDNTADEQFENGAIISGAGDNFYYGEEVSISAHVRPGYEFMGWFKAEEVIDDYETSKDISEYKYVNYQKIVNKTVTALTYAKTNDVDGEEIYTSKINVTGDENFVAVTRPFGVGDDLGAKVTIVAGNENYTYGYEANANNYLTAKVTFDEGKEHSASVVGYQWYLVNGEDGSTSTDHLIEGATSSTFLVPTGLNAGNYFYQCVVTLKRTDNGREGSIQPEKAKKLVVKKIGESDGDIEYIRSYDYEGIYDGEYHGISVGTVMGNLHPKKYKVYYSLQSMDTWADIVEGMKTTDESGNEITPTVFTSDDNSVPDNLTFKDVELDEEGNVVTHTVYFYVRVEEDGLDPNFKDYPGSATVKINPVVLKATRTTNVFKKIYDADTLVKGDIFTSGTDKYRLINGDGDKKYYTITNSMYLSEIDYLIVDCDASFNQKDVETANAVIMSNFVIKNRLDKKVNNNYVFNTGLQISGNINPFELHLSWNTEKEFVYDALEHSVGVNITNKADAPDEDVAVSSLGGQINVGKYTSTAALVTENKTYTTGDYKFDISSTDYKIIECEITVLPKDTTLTYNGETQYITTYKIKKGDSTNDVSSEDGTSEDGTCTNLPTGHHIKLSKIKTDKGGKNVGDYSIKTVKNSIQIIDKDGMDVTYNYLVKEGEGTLKITKKVVTISGITAKDKAYDNTCNAELKTEEKTLSDGSKVQVIKGATINGLYSNDELYVKADKVQNASFVSKNVANDIEVNFNIMSDALIGKAVDNYELDVENSTKKTTANITKTRIVVKVKDLSDGTIYGETPAFGVTYTGFKSDEDKKAMTGNPTYLLVSNNVSKEADTYKYSDETTGKNGYKIPYAKDGYVITLKTDEKGYVYGLSSADYVFELDEEQEESPAKLKIIKREISISGINRASVITKTYDSTKTVKEELVKDTDYSLNKLVSSSDVNGILPNDNVSVTFTKEYNVKDTTADKIKVTEVAIKSENEGNNYTLTNNSFDINGKITPAELTVKANDIKITYGQASAPTYTAKATGYVGSDRVNSLNTKELTNGNGITLTCEYDPSNSSKRGAASYTISVSNLTDANYTLNPVSGTLTVEKKKVIVGVEDASIVYGIGKKPTTFTGTFSGWEYGENETTVLGSKDTEEALINKIKYSIEEATDYVYKKEGYVINVSFEGGSLQTDNYIFEPKNGKFHVNKQFISISGIKVTPKNYDGNTKAVIDYSEAKFMCYVSGAHGKEYTAKQLFGLEDNATATEELKKSLEVGGTYLDTTFGEKKVLAKDVADNKDVALTLKLKSNSYLSERYELIDSSITDEKIAEIESEYKISSTLKRSQSKAKGDITPRPITIMVYYGSYENGSIKYGENIVADKYGYKVTSGSFVEVEGIGNLNGSIVYKVVDSAGKEYTNTSNAGTYYVINTGNLNSDGTNYELTLITTPINCVPLAVQKNKLKTPEPKWSTDNPGTINFAAVSNIGKVEVKEYQVSLYKDDSVPPIANNILTYVDNQSSYSVDYATAIRTAGPGKYTVKVKAIARTDEGINKDNCNVDDSDEGTSKEIYAAKVLVSYIVDDITSKAATTVKASPEVAENAGNESTITINNDSSYVMISGESADIKADWYNEEGYRTGYKLADKAWTITSLGKETTQIAVSKKNDNSGTGSYTASAKATLTAKDDINVTFALAKREATLSASVSPATKSVAYGYAAEDAPEYEAINSVETGDNITTDGYIYEYSWQYRKQGSSYVALVGQNESSTDKKVKIKTGFVTATYDIRCQVTATRKDNGESKVITTSASTAVIDKAVINGEKIKTVCEGWMYGETRKTPALEVIGGGNIPSDIGKKHYMFSTDKTNWTEWSSTKFPDNAGKYYLKTVVDSNDNYQGFETETITELTINKNKLTKKYNNEIFGNDDLTMTASAKAPYGTAKWPEVKGPKENTNSTSNYITVSYKAILYKKVEDSPVKVKEYTVADSDVKNNECSVNMTSDMNEKGVYYFTVQAISNNKNNCEDSDVFTSKEYNVYDTIQALDEDGNSLLNEKGDKAEYTYDSRKVKLSVEIVDDATYQWYKDGVAIDGATSTEITTVYVDESATYACRITVNGKDYETNHVELTIKPRVITIESLSDSKTYDATPLTYDKWSISENKNSILNANSAGNVVDSLTGNKVTGVVVNGTATFVKLDGEGKVVGTDNTLSIDNVVITEKTTDKVLYNADMLTAGTANYSLKTKYGLLTIKKKDLQLTSDSDTKVYDTLALTKKSCQVTGNTQLVTGDDLISAEYTGTITNVKYSGNNIVGVNNTFKNAVIKNSLGNDVTANYNIEYKYGTLTVTPRGVDNGAVFTSVLKVNGNTSENNIFDYIGSNIEPVETIRDTSLTNNDAQGLILVKGNDKDYTISGDISKKAVGNHTITINFRGNFKGTMDIAWAVKDVVAPTGKIKIVDKEWNNFTNATDIVYDTFYNQKKSVEITAQDEDGGSGVKNIEYYVFEKTEAKNGLTKEELDAIATWTSISNGGTFDIEPDRDIVIYEKVTDNAGNYSYTSTKGIVLETGTPLIENVEADTIYCIQRIIKVTDTNLDKVEVNGTKVTLDADGTYRLTPNDNAYTVKATDKAGNTTTISGIKVNATHTWVYSKDGDNKIVTKCSIPTCEHKDCSSMTVTIKANGGDYNGKTYAASVIKSADFVSRNGGTVGDIVYYKTDSATNFNENTRLTGAPVNAGTYFATVKVTSAEGKEEIAYERFVINRIPITELSISPNDFTFDENEHTTTVTVKGVVDGVAKTLTEGTDYEVVTDALNSVVRKATKVGTYTVRVNGIGNFKDTLEKTFVIVDRENPTVSGVENGKIYCKGAKFKAKDKNLSNVTITTEDGEVILNQNLTDTEEFEYTIEGTENGTVYTIVATDLSGNTNEELKVKVYKDHSFTNYIPSTTGTMQKADCDHECGAVDKRFITWGSVSFNYEYNYIPEGGTELTTGVQAVEARATHALVELIQTDSNGSRVIATKNVDCDSICGMSSNNVKNTATVYYRFTSYNVEDSTASEGDTLIPYEDENGVVYTYSLKVTPIKPDGTVVKDYAVTNEESFNSPDDIGYKTVVEYAPNCFAVPWEVIMKNMPVSDDTVFVPDSIYVKLLFAYSENADDTNTATGYQIISQQVGANDRGVICHKIDNGDGTYSYKGDYSVWKYQGGTKESYYHRIQVTGYMYQGVYYNISDKNYRSINDKNHEIHTIYYIPGEEQADGNDDGHASGTVIYELGSENGLPVVVFDYNDDNDVYNKAIGSIKYIVKDAYGQEVSSEELEAAIPSRGDSYRFDGWYDKKTGGNKVERIDELNNSITLYAHWTELEPPTGNIIVDTYSWSEYVNPITFDIFFNKLKVVTITAEDNSETIFNSGINNIKYFISSEKLSKADIESDSISWNEYSEPFQILDEKQHVIYAKITDNAGNVRYISSNGMIIDITKPVIGNIIDGHSYCDSVTFVASDKYLDKVLLDGVDISESITEGEYTVAVDRTKDSSVEQYHVITAIDKAGNKEEYNIILHNGHNYSEYKTIMPATSETYEIKQSHCMNKDCDVTREKMVIDGTITWHYEYSYTNEDGTISSGIIGEESGQRSTKAKVIIYRNGEAYDSKVVDVKEYTGDSNAIGEADYTFDFEYLTKDENGNEYTYIYEVYALQSDGETYSHDFRTVYENKNAIISYDPNCFDAVWRVTLSGDNIDEEMVPESINVKVLFATEDDAADSDYSIISQHEGNNGVMSRVKYDEENKQYVYEGEYPVWKYQAGVSGKSYYHRVQIVGYTIHGKHFDIRDKVDYKSDVSNRMWYNPETDSASHTMLIDLKENLKLPILYLDFNAEDAVGDTHYIIKYLFGAEVTKEELEAARPRRAGYVFAGWYDKKENGNKVESIDSLIEQRTLYAYWRYESHISSLKVNDKIYDGKPIDTPTYETNSNGTAEILYKKKGASDDTYSYEVPKDAGEYTVKVIIDQNDEYVEVEETADFTIEKKAINANISVSDKIYDGTVDAEFSINADTGIDGEEIIISGIKATFDSKDAAESKSVDINTENVKEEGNTNTDISNYKIIYPNSVPGKIIKRHVSVKPNAARKHIGKADPETFDYEVDDMVKGEVLEGIYVTREEGENAGDYAIIASIDNSIQSNINKNYDIDVTSRGTFTIEPHEPGEIVIENEVPSSCEENGSYDEVRYCDVCSEELTRTSKQVDALGHLYSHNPKFIWNDEYTECKAQFVCDRDENHVIILDCIVTKSTEDEELTFIDIYTATVEFEGETFTDTKKIVNHIQTDEDDKDMIVRVIVSVTEGIPDVPESLADVGIDTEEKIFDKMYKEVTDHYKGFDGIHTSLYDVILQVSYDKGKTWRIAKESDFPKDGLWITLPYPEGTSGETHKYVVTHMFTHDFHGCKIGDVEIPELRTVDEGVQIKVKSLSPIMIAWRELIHVTDVNIKLDKVTIKKKNEKVKLKVDLSPEDTDYPGLIWSSSDPSVATVDENGVVTAISNGKTTITVKTEDGGFKDICIVVVDIPEDTTTEEKTTKDKTTESKTTEDKTTEDKTTEDKTTEGKTTEDKTTEDKTTEDKTTEDKTTEENTTQRETTQGEDLTTATTEETTEAYNDVTNSDITNNETSKKSAKSPKTGDDATPIIMLWILIILSGTTVFVGRVKRGKSESEE